MDLNVEFSFARRAEGLSNSTICEEEMRAFQ